MFGEEIEHIFCLLFWYNNERKWTIQDTVSIVKPRKDAEQYKEGELVYAKFSQKTYKAAIVRLREIKEDLTEDAKKLENLFNANLGLTPNDIMEQMGVPVTTAMQEDEGNVVQKTPATQNTKPSTNKDSKKQKKPVKSKESTENTPNAKRSKSDKDERSENKKASNILKDEKKSTSGKS